MTVSIHKAAKAQPSSDAQWLVLVHQLPSTPAYNRVKIWRVLQGAGAVSLRNSVYALPNSAPARAVMTGILAEIERMGGDGLLYEARVVAGMRDDEIRAVFNTARDVDYHAILSDLRQCALRWNQAGLPEPTDPLLMLAESAA